MESVEEGKGGNSWDGYDRMISNEIGKIPPALSKISLSKNNISGSVNKTNDLKDVCYLFAYWLLNSK